MCPYDLCTLCSGGRSKRTLSFSPAWITYTAIHRLRKTAVRDITGWESLPAIKKASGPLSLREVGDGTADLDRHREATIVGHREEVAHLQAMERVRGN